MDDNLMSETERMSVEKKVEYLEKRLKYVHEWVEKGFFNFRRAN